MTCWPLILRELQSASRQKQTYLLRSYCAAAAMLSLFILLRNSSRVVSPYLGIQLFYSLNAALFVIILSACPLLTAQCISEEKREGTLGLIFLTPLSSWDIVISKLIGHGFRAVLMVLALLPMMVLPMLFGGVNARLLLTSLLTQASLFAIALCAGMVASIQSVTFIKSVVLAEALCVGTCFALCGFLWRSLALHMEPLLILTAFFCAGTMRYATVNLRPEWEQSAAEFRPAGWEQAMSGSTWARSIFRWNKARTLDRNPIAWLQEYSWTGRLAKWAWMAFTCISIVSILLFEIGDHFILGIVLALGVAFSSANSFRHERQSGALELLLIAPIKPDSLVLGRAWGVWVHFFPSITAFLVSLLFPLTEPFFPRELVSLTMLGVFLFVPLIGVYISLFPMHLFLAWFATFAFGALLPFGIERFFYAPVSADKVWVPLFFQFTAGFASYLLASEKLRTRLFAWR